MPARRILHLARVARRVTSRVLDRHAILRRDRIVLCLEGRDVGLIERIEWFGRHVRLSGHASTASLGIGFDDHGRMALSESFDVILIRPARDATLTVRLCSDAGTARLRLAPPSVLTAAMARLVALGRMVAALMANPRTLARFARTGDPDAALHLRRALGLDDAERGFPVPPDLFGVRPTPRPGLPPVIVLPVFNAADDLSRLLDRLPDTLPIDAEIVIVDDGSTDPRISGLLDRAAADLGARCRVHRHPDNRGFVAAANTGLAVARQLSAGHVILLNSDTCPPCDWVPRLLAPIERDPGVASATPMSNAAEILSIPGPGASPMPDTAAMSAIDAVAARLSEPRNVVEIPTGIGFCLALNRRFLDRIGGFDPAFGRGYGEEVDWCRKAAALGGRHVAVTGLFVAHRGGSSFGADEKTARTAAASALITRRYPGFDADVARWSDSAPAAAQRLALSLAWLGASSLRPVPIFLGHSQGGGAETALSVEIAAALDGGAAGCIILRVGGPAPWRVDLILPGSRQSGEVRDIDLLMSLLRPIRRRAVIYSCGVGAADPAGMLRLLDRLTEDSATFHIRLHDFYPVSPSWNLLDEAGRYSGPPAAASLDPAHRIAAASGRAALSLADWRRLWHPLIDRADEVTAFSPSSVGIFAEAYPHAAPKLVLRPHDLHWLPEPVEAGGRSLGVLGGINLAKGGRILEALARHPSPHRIVVIGELDGQFRLPPPHVVHGRYARDAISDLARQHDIGLWLIPSVCPETFSFATHEALATGLPVLGFGIGAQGDALGTAANGHVLTIAPDDTAALHRRITAAFRAQSLTRLRSAS